MNIFRLLNNDIQDLSEEERIFAESFNEALRNNIIDALVEYEIEELIKQLKFYKFKIPLILLLKYIFYNINFI